jgi:hypothetical protein
MALLGKPYRFISSTKSDMGVLSGCLLPLLIASSIFCSNSRVRSSFLCSLSVGQNCSSSSLDFSIWSVVREPLCVVRGAIGRPVDGPFIMHFAKFKKAVVFCP